MLISSHLSSFLLFLFVGIFSWSFSSIRSLQSINSHLIFYSTQSHPYLLFRVLLCYQRPSHEVIYKYILSHIIYLIFITTESRSDQNMVIILRNQLFICGLNQEEISAQSLVNLSPKFINWLIDWLVILSWSLIWQVWASCSIFFDLNRRIWRRMEREEIKLWNGTFKN